MQIAANTVVTLNYRVTDEAGEVIDSGQNPITYLHGGFGGIFPKIEELLNGCVAGDAVKLVLQPEDAFGQHDEDGVRAENLADMPAGIEVGVQLHGQNEEGQESLFTVVHIEGDKVVLDANHPLAGVVIVFDCTVASVRTATAEELAHGHVHGEGGHHH